MRRALFPVLAPSMAASMAASLAACGGWGGGTAWVQQPLTPEEEASGAHGGGGGGGGAAPARSRFATRTIGAHGNPGGANADGEPGPTGDRTGGGGRVLGIFRNTYYDFPREADFGGASVDVMSASCAPITKVARGFYDAVCVQGSGALKAGGTLSFAKRDCDCAEVCPRTGQKICFEALDARAFPFGRGATGKPITPLRSIAADTSVLPMGTVVYIPELDGAPRSAGSDGSDGGDTVDGCFIVEDRGSRVKGAHVDIFTGNAGVTALMNERVPSNAGVTVVVDAPRCARFAR